MFNFFVPFCDLFFYKSFTTIFLIHIKQHFQNKN